MTKDEAIKILAILKAAYPNAYKGMTREEATGTIGVWAIQFAKIPYFIVSLAVNRAIGQSSFSPSIYEVKEQLKKLYREAEGMMLNHKTATVGVIYADGDDPLIYGTPLDEKTLAAVNEIMRVCAPDALDCSLKESLHDMIVSMPDSLPDADKKLLEASSQGDPVRFKL